MNDENFEPNKEQSNFPQGRVQAFVGRLFSFYSDDDGFMWFRIFGYGLAFANRERMAPPFSVRYGHTKEHRIGRYGIQLLTPDKQHAK